MERATWRGVAALATALVIGSGTASATCDRCFPPHQPLGKIPAPAALDATDIFDTPNPLVLIFGETGTEFDDYRVGPGIEDDLWKGPYGEGVAAVTGAWDDP